MACQGITMEDYALDLAQAAKPGPRVASEIAKTPLDGAFYKMGSLYRRFREAFVRIDDAPARDAPAVAEHILAETPPRGDCEDFAALMLAFAQALELDGRIALLDDQETSKGHARMELRLGQLESPDQELRYLNATLPAPLQVVEDAQGSWAVLDLLADSGSAAGFNVYPDGTLERRP